MTRISNETIIQFPSETEIENHLRNPQKSLQLNEDQILSIAAVFKDRRLNSTSIEDKIIAIVENSKPSEAIEKVPEVIEKVPEVIEKVAEDKEKLPEDKKKVAELAKSLQEYAIKPSQTQSLKRSFRCLSLAALDQS